MIAVAYKLHQQKQQYETAANAAREAAEVAKDSQKEDTRAGYGQSVSTSRDNDRTSRGVQTTSRPPISAYHGDLLKIMAAEATNVDKRQKK